MGAISTIDISKNLLLYDMKTVLIIYRNCSVYFSPCGPNFCSTCKCRSKKKSNQLGYKKTLLIFIKLRKFIQ